MRKAAGACCFSTPNKAASSVNTALTGTAKCVPCRYFFEEGSSCRMTVPEPEHCGVAPLRPFAGLGEIVAVGGGDASGEIARRRELRQHLVRRLRHGGGDRLRPFAQFRTSGRDEAGKGLDIVEGEIGQRLRSGGERRPA